MAKRHFRIKPYKHPRLKFVVRSKVTGKWERRFFRTKAEAETYAAQKEIELLNQGSEAMAFPTELRVMAQRAARQLAEYKKTISDAVEFYVRHLDATTRSVPLAVAMRELIENRRGARPAPVLERSPVAPSRGFARRFPTEHWPTFPRPT